MSAGRTDLRDAEVIVIGAGIVGAAVARALALAGARVTVLDRGASAGGTSAAGEGNLLVSDKGPGAELDLAVLSRRLWQKVAEELPAELGPRFPGLEYEAKGGLVAATEALLASARRHGAQVRPPRRSGCSLSWRRRR